MRIETLDHVALWVSDRGALADFLIRHLGMHVIDRTDKFTLVGADARRGKLTLFEAEAEGEREPGVLARVALAVPDLERALRDLPDDLEIHRARPGAAFFTGPERLGLGLVESTDVAEFDFEHIAFRVSEPERTEHELLDFGFELLDGRLRVGSTYAELEQGEPDESERPLLNHLGLRVESAQEHIAEAESRGLEIADVVDAPNTYAVFVWGPDRIKLEYVEHKASFSLV